MPLHLHLGGYVVGRLGARQQLSAVECPAPHEVEAALSNLEGRSGVVVLEVADHDPRGAYRLVATAENGKYLVLLSEFRQDGEHAVRAPSRQQSNDEFVSIAGEPHHASTLVTDFRFVRRVFLEFASTGNVGAELLS